MNPEHFVSLAWDEISKHGEKAVKDSTCVCRKLNGVYILCEGHKQLVESTPTLRALTNGSES